MDSKVSKILFGIMENKSQRNEILKLKNDAEIYQYISKYDDTISKDEFNEFVASFVESNKSNVLELSESDLKSVTGGIAPKTLLLTTLAMLTISGSFFPAITASATFGESSDVTQSTSTSSEDTIDCGNLFTRELTEEEMKNVDTYKTFPELKFSKDKTDYNLPEYFSSNSAGEKIFNNLRINATELNNLAQKINSSSENQGIINQLKDYFMREDNIYNPQKRFALSYLIYSTKDKTIFEIGEQVNQKILINALMPQNGKFSDEQRTLIHLLFLAQLGKTNFNQGGNYKAVEQEYVSSLFAYGETVITQLPKGVSNKFIEKNILTSYTSASTKSRTSTHIAAFDDNNKAEERKIKVPLWLQKGANIDISKKNSRRFDILL